MSQAATILVVEDNPLNMELAVVLLEHAGYVVLQAVTAEEALQLAPAAMPDLVLMDIALPGIDGLEATRRLRENVAMRDIPFVAFTASAMQADEERAIRAGCLGVIRKPINTRDFAERVTGYLEGARRRAAPGEAPGRLLRQGDHAGPGGRAHAHLQQHRLAGDRGRDHVGRRRRRHHRLRHAL